MHIVIIRIYEPDNCFLTTSFGTTQGKMMMPIYLETSLIFTSIPSRPCTEELAGTNLIISLGEIFNPSKRDYVLLMLTLALHSVIS